MKATLHTPGPWKAIFQPNTPCLVESESQRVAWIDFWDGKLPRVSRHKDQLEQESTARLIAAAPELLAALQEAKEALVDEFDRKQLLPDSALGQIIQQCASAIARATNG